MSQLGDKGIHIVTKDTLLLQIVCGMLEKSRENNGVYCPFLLLTRTEFWPYFLQLM
jgi:hypothetical protein